MERPRLTTTRRTLMTLLLLGAATLAAPGAASANHVVCGEIITEDIVLTEDLICAEGEGAPAPGPDAFWNPPTYSLLVGADGVTVDLNGHLVGSQALSIAPGIGVFGHSDVVIKNGRTSHVTLVDTTDSQLIGIRALHLGLTRSDRSRVADSTAGIGLSQSADNVIEANTAGSEGGGVTLASRSNGNVVRDNTICGGMGLAFTIADSSYNLIENNTVPGCSGWSDTSVVVGDTSIGNSLIGNTVIGEPGPFEPHEPDVEEAPGDGIRVHSPATFLSGNVTNANHGYGINAVEGVKSGVNYANGNGHPQQCRNVICVPGSPGPVGPPGLPGHDGRTGQSPADMTPPLMSISSAAIQRRAKTIRLAITAISEDLWASASARLTFRGSASSYRFVAVTDRFIARGGKVILHLALRPKARRAVGRTLGQGRRPQAALTVRARDLAGNLATEQLSIAIKR
jgi:parallel beta-helix repeat protein